MFTTKLFLTWHSSPWELHKTSQGSLQTLKFHTIWSLKLKTDGTFKISGLTQKLGTKAQAKESSLSIGGLRSAFEDYYMIRLSFSSSSWWQIKAQEFQLLHKKLLHNYSNSCLILPPPPNVGNLIITNTITNHDSGFRAAQCFVENWTDRHDVATLLLSQNFAAFKRTSSPNNAHWPGGAERPCQICRSVSVRERCKKWWRGEI